MASLVLSISLLVGVLTFTSDAGPPDVESPDDTTDEKLLVLGTPTDAPKVDDIPFLLGIPTKAPKVTDIPYACPENEKYHKCDEEVCYKTCEHLRRPPACPSVDPKCYKPACLCMKDTLRDSAGKCVPVNRCP